MYLVAISWIEKRALYQASDFSGDQLDTMSLDVLQIETALLTGRWGPSIHPRTSAVELFQAVVNGALKDALTSSHSRELFEIRDTKSLDTPLDVLFDLSSSVGPEQDLIKLSLAVACLHVFIQANWTGPDVDVWPLQIISTPENSIPLTEDDLNRKAISELAYGGEPAYHLTQHPIFLRLAQILLALPYDHCPSVAWWRLRAALVHQQILDEPVALPESVLTSLEPFAELIHADRGLTGRLLLEKGLLEHLFGRDKSAADHFVRAARATGLDYELTGFLGKRTKFQETDVSQLVLLAESHLVEGSSKSEEPPKAGHEETQNLGNSATTANFPETLALNDDILLEHTEFTSSAPASGVSRLSHIDPATQPPLHPLDQCILLALCLNVKNTSPSHGLTNEQMSPYVSRIISHPRNWSVHTMALLLRSRLESTRTRTAERSTLQLQALLDQMPTADSSLSERLLYFYTIPLPSKWELQRELALRFMSLGAVKSALEIFERLEMWEEVVKCWTAMERRDKAIAIVRDLLEGRKEESETILAKRKAISNDRRQSLDSAREAKLWCLLGDLEPDNGPQHYNHAWSISKETSGRAMRSLGGYHFVRGNYPNAIAYLTRAVSINPLLSRSWFILGCACVRVEDWTGARDAFSRCVAIDDEDGESWNNLASVYLRMGTGSRGPIEMEAKVGVSKELRPDHS
jgi:tetratricopeptide (TPR) repeat protein